MLHLPMTYQSAKDAANPKTTTKGRSRRLTVSISYGNSNEIEMAKPRPAPYKREMPLCTFFQQGRCNRGSACRFSHQVPPKVVVAQRQTTENKPPKSQFPALCKQANTPTLQVGSAYKTKAAIPAPEVQVKAPYVKRKKMVVIYRRIQNGKFTCL